MPNLPSFVFFQHYTPKTLTQTLNFSNNLHTHHISLEKQPFFIHKKLAILSSYPLVRFVAHYSLLFSLFHIHNVLIYNVEILDYIILKIDLVMDI